MYRQVLTRCESVASFDTKVTKAEFKNDKERRREREKYNEMTTTSRQFRRLFREWDGTAENFVTGNDSVTINHSHPSVRLKPGRATLAAPFSSLSRSDKTLMTPSKRCRAGRVYWKESSDPREIDLRQRSFCLYRSTVIDERVNEYHKCRGFYRNTNDYVSHFPW